MLPVTIQASVDLKTHKNTKFNECALEALPTDLATLDWINERRQSRVQELAALGQRRILVSV